MQTNLFSRENGEATSTPTLKMPSIEEKSRGTAPTLTRCPLCDTPLDPAHPDECPKCDWVVGYRRERSRPVGTGRDTTSVIMSIIPGLGHLYKGHYAAAPIAFGGALLAVFAVVVAATATMGLALVLLPLYWGAVMLHVYWADDWAAERASHQHTAPAH